MLKIATEPEQRQGSALMIWWDGDGAATPCGPRGWLAIDPKGLCGESGFDFVNIFCNPDFALATAPGRLVRQATVVAEVAGLERKRLLQWILSYAGISAAWTSRDGDDPKLALSVAEAAAPDLNQ
jgi:streptomycin 6-kinase